VSVAVASLKVRGCARPVPRPPGTGRTVVISSKKRYKPCKRRLQTHSHSIGSCANGWVVFSRVAEFGTIEKKRAMSLFLSY